MGGAGGRGRSALSAPEPPEESTPEAPPSWRGALFGVPGTRPSILLLVWVALVAGGFVYARGGIRPESATVWAEDGFIFIHDAVVRHGPFLVFEPAVGYLNVLPRLLGIVCSLFPLDQAAFIMAVLTSLVQGILCAVGFEVMRSRCGTVWPGMVVATIVALPAVGTETIRNAANLQWFLVPVVLLTVFWTPRGLLGAGVRVVLVALTATSSPFGFALLVLLAVRCVVRRTWTDAVTAAVALVLVPFQVRTLLAAGEDRPLEPPAPFAEISAGFVRRVVGDGVLGIGRHTPTQLSPELGSGVVVGLLLVLTLVALAFTVRRVELLFPVVLLVLAMGFYWLLLHLNGLPTNDPFAGQRYAVTPVILLLTAVTHLAWVASRPLAAGTRSAALGVHVARVPAFVLLGAALFGVVSTVPSYNWMRNGPTAPWPVELEKARATCRTPVASGELQIEPPGVMVSLPCYVFDPSRLQP